MTLREKLVKANLLVDIMKVNEIASLTSNHRLHGYIDGLRNNLQRCCDMLDMSEEQFYQYFKSLSNNKNNNETNSKNRHV